MAAQPRRAPRLLHVKDKRKLTPNMIRVTLTADWVSGLPSGIEGAHCKLFLPEPGRVEQAFLAQIADGARPAVRTYTIRHIRPEAAEMDIDFVDHGDAGPASAWARRVSQGDFCAFGGPGPVKMSAFYADYYLVAADMSALPVASAALEAMPRDAKGLAIFEITDPADRQEIDAPQGIAMHWLVHPDTSTPPTQAVDLITGLPAFEGRVQTCIAGESSMIKALRSELLVTRAVAKEDAYISGYWKVGLIEDEHQQAKRREVAPGA